MRPPRVFDVHVHYGPRPNGDPSRSPEFHREMLAYACSRLNIRKVALLGRKGEDDWQTTLDAHEAHPDLFIPLAQVFLDEDGAGPDLAAARSRLQGPQDHRPEARTTTTSRTSRSTSAAKSSACRSSSTPASGAARSTTCCSTRATRSLPSAPRWRWRSAAAAPTAAPPACSRSTWTPSASPSRACGSSAPTSATASTTARRPSPAGAGTSASTSPAAPWSGGTSSIAR